MSIKEYLRGSVITHHDGITDSVTEANTDEINLENFNSVLIEATVTGKSVWGLTIYGKLTTGGVHLPYGDAAASTLSNSISSSVLFNITELPPFAKIVPTKSSGTGSLTLRVMPYNSAG